MAAAAASRKIRWGILSTANIARKNSVAIRASRNAQLEVVASRSLDRAKAFAKANGIPRALGSYKELFADEKVDAIYLPVPTGLRAELAIEALKAGKHVLIEKPAAVCLADLRRMVDAARSHKNGTLLLMDGIMFRHSERMRLYREIMDDKERIGDLLRVDAQFSFLGGAGFENNVRMSKDLEPMGALGDVGIYPAAFASFAFGEQPASVSAHFHSTTKDGVPTDFSAVLQYSGAKVASVDGSFTRFPSRTAAVHGTKGSLTIGDCFHNELETWHEVRTHTTVADPEQKEKGKTVTKRTVTRRDFEPKVVQHVAMIEAFSQMIIDGKIDPKWTQLALETQAVLDACEKSARSNGAVVEVEKI